MIKSNENSQKPLRITNEQELIIFLDSSTKSEIKIIHSIFHFMKVNKEAFPSYETIAENAGCCKTTVKTFMKKFEGVLFRTQKRYSGKRRTSNLYETDYWIMTAIIDLEEMMNHLSNFNDWSFKIKHELFDKGLTIRDIKLRHKQVINKKEKKLPHQVPKIAPYINSYINTSEKDTPSNRVESGTSFKINEEMWFSVLPKERANTNKLREFERIYGPAVIEMGLKNYKSDYVNPQIEVRHPMSLMGTILRQKQSSFLGRL